MRYMLFFLQYNVNNDGMNAYHSSYETYDEALEAIWSDYYKDNVYNLQLYDTELCCQVTGLDFIGNIEYNQLKHDIVNDLIPPHIQLLVLDHRISWEKYLNLRSKCNKDLKDNYYTLAKRLNTEELYQFVKTLT